METSVRKTGKGGTFLGWFFGKCLVESRGLFWPWLFHAAQDILPFTMMALAAVA